MSNHFLLDLISLAISLFNAIVLVWLGLTVLLNAEHRSWGVLLAVVGLLVGAAFFTSHSIVLASGAGALVQGFSFWWEVGWLPVIAAPCAWYLLMLWYCGFWEDRGSRLRRRQAPWLGLVMAFTLLLAGLLLAGNPLPEPAYGTRLDVEQLPGVRGAPLLFLVYPVYILMCTGLSLDALLGPAPSGRAMGDLARRRARPWLASASFVLLLVSLLVGAAIFWLQDVARLLPDLAQLIAAEAIPLAVLDLLLETLVMVAILLLGQAIVSYEIFTGKSLPRRGFRRQWWILLLLAAALSGLAALGLTAREMQTYSLIGILLLAALSYAWFGWQNFAEREHSMRQLRPFIASQRLFENIMRPAGAAEVEVDLAAPFNALCRDLLGAREAALLPLGALSAWGISPLRYPPGSRTELPALSGYLRDFTSPQMAVLPVEAGGIPWWVVPLWRESGLAGLLLLGEKSDGGFYSLEEIEIARASGERLADTLASAEMARRLVALQRQRLVESGILDRRARRVLHDDVLPRLHTALLGLSSPAQASGPEGRDALDLLAATHRQISDLLHELPPVTRPDVIRSGFRRALRSTLEGELKGMFDVVNDEIGPEAEKALDTLPPLVAEVVFFAAREAMRNAALHGRRGREVPLCLTLRAESGETLKLIIEDDGAGFPAGGWDLAGASPANGRPAQESGSSARARLPESAEPSRGGSGQGLALHSTLMAVAGGVLKVESVPGQFTRVTLDLPRGAWEG